MRLTDRRLNRTLLRRQHLLERTPGTVRGLVGHLVGLQGQDHLAPYVGLAARLDDLDAEDVTRGLEDRSLVRLLTMRGTVHLLRAGDAVVLRAWTQPRIERELRSSPLVGAARDVDRAAFDAAVRAALADGPLPLAELAARLATTFPGVPAAALGHLARLASPLAQLPPRGCWGRSGGVVHDLVDRWTGLPLAEPDVPELVRRYLRAFGPATAADLTAWSGVIRLGPVITAMPGLVRHEDERGRVLVDVPEGELEDEAAPAPVRLLGIYDNLWLAHAGRDRVTTTAGRAMWSGPNGGAAHTVFVDGMLAGLWRVDRGRVEVTETLRPLSARERSQLDDEVSRVDQLLAAGRSGPAGATPS